MTLQEDLLKHIDDYFNSHSKEEILESLKNCGANDPEYELKYFDQTEPYIVILNDKTFCLDAVVDCDLDELRESILEMLKYYKEKDWGLELGDFKTNKDLDSLLENSFEIKKFREYRNKKGNE